MPDHGFTTIGKYEIVDLVGEGAMGVVYRARDSVLNRMVAIKVMNDAVARQADLRERFLHEAQAAGSLQHPNVITIFDFGEIEGHLFLAMEYIDGVDLERLLASREPLTLQVKLDLAIEVLSGLAYAHKRGIIHRDIKPANIRITDDGHAKIMDFGVAHLASSSMTVTGMMVGTPSYMSPEQVTGGKVTPPSDLFAFGAVLYELLTNTKPFEGPTLHGILYKIVSENPPPLAKLLPGLPPALDRIVSKALSKDIASRYQSAVDMANDLSAVRASLSGPTTAGTVSLRASLEHARAELDGSLERERHRKVARSVVALAAVAGVIVIAWSAVSNDGSRGTTVGQQAESGQRPAPSEAAPRYVTPALQSAGSVMGSAAAPSAPRPAVPLPAVPSGVTTTTPPHAPPRRAAMSSPTTAVSPPRRPAPSARPTVAEPPPSALVVPTPAPVAVTTPPPQATVAPAIVTPPPPAQLAANPAVEIGAVVAGYARAIESRELAAVRRAYPGISAAQLRGFEQFFDAARSIRATFVVSRVEVANQLAEATVTGAYDYVSDGKSQHQPVNFQATLRRDSSGGGWQLVSVR